MLCADVYGWRNICFVFLCRLCLCFFNLFLPLKMTANGKLQIEGRPNVEKNLFYANATPLDPTTVTLSLPLPLFLLHHWQMNCLVGSGRYPRVHSIGQGKEKYRYWNRDLLIMKQYISIDLDKYEGTRSCEKGFLCWWKSEKRKNLYPQLTIMT